MDTRWRQGGRRGPAVTAVASQLTARPRGPVGGTVGRGDAPLGSLSLSGQAVVAPAWSAVTLVSHGLGTPERCLRSRGLVQGAKASGACLPVGKKPRRARVSPVPGVARSPVSPAPSPAKHLPSGSA